MASGVFTFALTVHDGRGGFSFDTAQITSNGAPVAHDDSRTTPEDIPFASVLSATTPGGSLTFSIVANGTLGTAVITNASTGGYTYTPIANVNGTDSFTFKVNNGTILNVATITVVITPVNDPPVAVNGALSTNEDTAGIGSLSATDIDSPSLTFSIVSNGTKGTAAITNPATGAYTYTPNANANGSGDSFTFKANDGAADSNIATVSITINPVNDPPIAASGSLSTNEDTPASGTLSASDVDGDPLTFIRVSSGTKGRFTITNASTGAFTYTPYVNANGSDSFSFKVNDGAVDSNVAIVTVTITGANDAPVAQGQTLFTLKNTARLITLTGSDPEGDSITFSVVDGPSRWLVERQRAEPDVHAGGRLRRIRQFHVQGERRDERQQLSYGYALDHADALDNDRAGRRIRWRTGRGSGRARHRTPRQAQASRKPSMAGRHGSPFPLAAFLPPRTSPFAAWSIAGRAARPRRAALAASADARSVGLDRTLLPRRLRPGAIRTSDVRSTASRAARWRSTSRRRTGGASRHEAASAISSRVRRPAARCKRLNLFLRWMVRRDEVDLGVWTSVSQVEADRSARHPRHPARTLPEADAVHLAGLAHGVGDHGVASSDRSDDPVRFDFSLCHVGMMNACGFGRRQGDAQCPLKGMCRPRGRASARVGAIVVAIAAFVVAAAGFAAGWLIGGRRTVLTSASPTRDAVAFVFEGRCAAGFCQSLYVGPNLRTARSVETLSGAAERADEIAVDARRRPCRLPRQRLSAPDLRRAHRRQPWRGQPGRARWLAVERASRAA